MEDVLGIDMPEAGRDKKGGFVNLGGGERNRAREWSTHQVHGEPATR